jgi:putative oxygen-independent coproporphyrinogen III oxidase
MTHNTGLYIHIPWCIKKCPYCDFNSHKSAGNIPEMAYIQQLINDFKQDSHHYPKSQIDTIFIGGGTPSLMSANAYELLFDALRKIIPWRQDIEITLEANPGTVDNTRFKDYRALGINRLSIGVQSFDDKFLKKLGRVHDAKKALEAIEKAHLAGFENINIDLMYGLPQQTPLEALNDLNTAIDCQPNHLSWYELTIEPNTVFYKNPPTQPSEDTFIEIEEQGRALLKNKGFERYEISAYGKNKARCQHNLNYWHYGDYYGIGAGAHSKLTTQEGTIVRMAKIRMPNSYLDSSLLIAETRQISETKDIMFEYMLNACRLLQAHPLQDFKNQTGLNIGYLQSFLIQAQQQGLVAINDDTWQITPHGLRYNNEIMQLFL